MSILILGFPGDVHIHAVRWALDQAGADHQVLYTPDLPQMLRASVRLGGGMLPTASFHCARTAGKTGDYDTVWFRRSGLSMRPPSMPDADWTIAERECDHHIAILRQHLAPNAYWVNDAEARERAMLKSPQLEAARQCGLATPDTLYSNDPDEIRRFYAEHRESGVIFKLVHQSYWHAQASGARHALFTTQLRDEDLRDDAALSVCPATYQRKIEKRYELRVTCMDEACYPARLDSQSREKTRMDWRSDFSQPLVPQRVELPPQVEERCVQLMRRLGLAFGCIDLIVTPEGDYVFLEVNEMGQFLFVEERAPEIPLLRAFATLLVERKLTRSSKLVGSEQLNYAAYLACGDFDLACAADGVHHAPYQVPGLALEP
ncbi:hypothetical protein [Piscinibacter sp.]|uniref:hypothetical protein n=1 Tax=Piscinibacter sp. TaxID=1903157 RepID=UPI00355A267B